MMYAETKKRDAKIMEWKEANRQLVNAKDRELELRKKVLIDFFDYEEDDREGSENIELGKGYKLNACFKLNRLLDNKDGAVDDALSKMKDKDLQGELLAERIVRWKAELSLSEYKKLSDEFKAIIDSVIVAKPGLPSLKIVEPKSKRL